MSEFNAIEDLLVPRRKSNDFRWASRNWSPSSCFTRGKQRDPKELISLVLASNRVKEAIKEVCQRDGKEEKEVTKQAKTIITELAHDFHLYAVRWFGLILSKLGKKLYSGIYVNTEKLDKIKQGFRSYPVIILPTHRSYVDFLLISYICFHYELPLPIIAAGMDFMGMVGVGEMLRKSGAFFIRRKFGDDVLYWAIVSEYVKLCVIEGGHPVEMFVEGTRSRSAKSLSPKIGLLSVILEMVRSAEIPDILILPISMSYDRTLEEKLYAHELLGQPKPKESTNGLVKALRWLGSQSYGCVYVNFGDLISVRQLIQRQSFVPSPTDNNMFSQQVQSIALTVIVDHQNNLVVPLFAGISSIILAHRSRCSTSLKFSELMYYMSSLKELLLARRSYFGYPMITETLEKNVQFIMNVHSALMCYPDADGGISLKIDINETVQCMQLQHYSNQLLPLIAPFSLAATVCKSRHPLETSYSLTPTIVEEYSFLRRLFSEDFVYVPKSEAEELTWAVDILNSKPIAANNGDGVVSFSRILALLLEPYILSYIGLISTLFEIDRGQKGPVEVKQLGKLTQEFINEKMKSHMPRQFGSLSLDTLTNATSSLAKAFGVAKIKMETGNYATVVHNTQLLSETLSRLEKLLEVDWFVVNLEKLSMEPNFEIRSSRIPQLRSKL